jgi:4-hydroxy-3-polyprenylbenzoate decarboxylase
MKKIVIAITGASGSLYSKLLLDKLEKLRDQWDDAAVIITENAKQVWQTELGDKSYQKTSLKISVCLILKHHLPRDQANMIR